MKMIFFLIVLFSAAMTISAKQYCQESMVNNENSILLSCEQFGTNYRLTIEGENLQGFGGSFCTINEKQNVALSDYASVSSDNKKIIVNLISTSVPVFYTPLYVLMPGEVSYAFPNDVEWGKCSQDQTKYTITVTQPAAGGTIAADMTEAEYGMVVTLTATPAEGKKLDAWDVKDASQNPIGVSKAGTFVMPQSNVTVTATFKDKEDLVPATWNGTDEIECKETKYPVAWSITRNADATLTFKVVVTGTVPGFVPEINIKDAYPPMVAMDSYWAYSTEDTYEDGDEVVGFFWLKFEAGVKRIDWTGYTVGASNEPTPAAIEEVESQKSKVESQKIIENGQFIIIKNGARYNAAGQAVK